MQRSKMVDEIVDNVESDECLYEDWYDQYGNVDPNGSYDVGGHFYMSREIPKHEYFYED